MKKLKLNLSDLPGAELLTLDQLKKIIGGTGSGTCSSGCNSADDCPSGQHCSGGNNKPDCSGTCHSN